MRFSIRSVNIREITIQLPRGFFPPSFPIIIHLCCTNHSFTMWCPLYTYYITFLKAFLAYSLPRSFWLLCLAYGKVRFHFHLCLEFKPSTIPGRVTDLKRPVNEALSQSDFVSCSCCIVHSDRIWISLHFSTQCFASLFNAVKVPPVIFCDQVSDLTSDGDFFYIIGFSSHSVQFCCMMWKSTFKTTC